ncbi:MAG: hypothetical protein KGL39_41235 [Patescibacteria group bacterium]|nr:hypothetical protein [Patescibacteria group bacterium]
MAKDLNEAAAELGRRGGQRKVPKGFALMSDEERRRIQSLGGKARWAGKKKTAGVPPKKRAAKKPAN